ncbi:MAG TPA: D-alanyl-D-alanine carboxypeptidase family protein [Candidatus Eisenbacteria bacterium]|nr:D-alanyl-D-alanine carboxypeptidase family protein [Candidatus Eisenbacteria bacterium]
MSRLVALAITLGFLLAAAPVPAASPSGQALSVSAGSVLLLDADGKVVFAKNPSEDHAPASLTKLMTLYLAYEDLEAGKVEWDEPVAISRRAADTARYRMGLRAGESVPLSILLEGVAIASANDAAAAVAEHLAGNEEAFVHRMNNKAQLMGLVGTRFANPHGLPDPLQRTTAQDMATLIGNLVTDYPASRTILGGKTFVFRGRVYARRIPLFDDPGGVQALKTGFTNEAGYNLAIAAWRAGQRFLLIVLGSQTRSLSFRDARKVLQYGFVANGLDIADDPPRRPAPPARRGPRRSSASIPSSG